MKSKLSQLIEVSVKRRKEAKASGVLPTIEDSSFIRSLKVYAASGAMVSDRSVIRGDCNES